MGTEHTILARHGLLVNQIKRLQKDLETSGDLAYTAIGSYNRKLAECEQLQEDIKKLVEALDTSNNLLAGYHTLSIASYCEAEKSAIDTNNDLLQKHKG